MRTRTCVCASVVSWAFAGLLQVAPAYALTFTYNFSNITHNNPASAAIGEAQLFMDVSDEGVPAGQALFTFRNVGPEASSITDIYFDDMFPTVLSDISYITNYSGVDFSEGASPGDLPGGQSYSFSADHSADSDPPAQPNGVNPGEKLDIVFNLVSGYLFNNVIAGLDSGDLRVGIHVQGFDGGYSEAFINNPAPVPEPATFVLVGSALAGLPFIRRRFGK